MFLYNLTHKGKKIPWLFLGIFFLFSSKIWGQVNDSDITTKQNGVLTVGVVVIAPDILKPIIRPTWLGAAQTVDLIEGIETLSIDRITQIIPSYSAKQILECQNIYLCIEKKRQELESNGLLIIELIPSKDAKVQIQRILKQRSKSGFSLNFESSEHVINYNEQEESSKKEQNISLNKMIPQLKLTARLYLVHDQGDKVEYYYLGTASYNKLAKEISVKSAQLVSQWVEKHPKKFVIVETTSAGKLKQITLDFEKEEATTPEATAKIQDKDLKNILEGKDNKPGFNPKNLGSQVIAVDLSKKTTDKAGKIKQTEGTNTSDDNEQNNDKTENTDQKNSHSKQLNKNANQNLEKSLEKSGNLADVEKTITHDQTPYGSNISAKTNAQSIDREPYLAKALLATAKNQYVESLDFFQKAIAEEPQNAGIYYEAFCSARKVDQKEKALQFISQASVLEPKNITYSLEYAKQLMTQGRGNEALSIFQNILDENPYHPGVLFLAGVASIDAKDFEKAKEFFQKSANITSPYQSQAYYLLARLQSKQGLHTDSMMNLAKAIEIDPSLLKESVSQKNWSHLFQVVSGTQYDSNVPLIPDLFLYHLYGTAQTQTSSATSGFRWVFQLNSYHKTHLSNAVNLEFRSSLYTGIHLNDRHDLSEFDIISPFFEARINYKKGFHLFSENLAYQGVFTDGLGINFSQSLKITPLWYMGIFPIPFEAGYSMEYQKFVDAPSYQRNDNNRDSIIHEFAIRPSFSFMRIHSDNNLSYIYNHAAGKNHRFHEISIFPAITIPASEHIAAILDTELRYKIFSDFASLGYVERKDLLWRLGMGLKNRINSNWHLHAAFQYTTNVHLSKKDGEISPFEYDRFLASCMLVYNY